MLKTSDTLKLPDLPTLFWGDFCWSTKLTLPSWAGFLSMHGPYCSQSSGMRTDGSVTVDIPPCEDGNPPDYEQIAALHYLIDNECEVQSAALEAIFQSYPVWKDVYSFSDREMPPLQSTRQLRSLIGPSIVHILPCCKEGVAYFGIELGCTWDPEHGVGVLMHKTRVLDAGLAEISFDGGLTEDDANRP